jgi:hypothetical protein
VLGTTAGIDVAVGGTVVGVLVGVLVGVFVGVFVGVGATAQTGRLMVVLLNVTA